MGRYATAAILALGLWALGAAPASASFHLLKINEVMVSAGGDPTAQFVELHDPENEPFPAALAPYKLIVYDAAGMRLGEEDLGSGTAISSHLPFMLLSTPSADAKLGTTADKALTISLPTGAGQLCYTQGVQENMVHCLAWGTITKPVGTEDKGATPPDGESAQRQDDGSVIVASPTPKAQNATMPTPDGGSTGGEPPAGGDTGGGQDQSGAPAEPVISAELARRRLGSVLRRGMLVRVRVDRAATVVVRLRLTRVRARRLHVPTQIGRASARLADAGRATLSARLGRRVRARLARVRRLALTVVVDVTGADGARTRVSRKLTLRR